MMKYKTYCRHYGCIYCNLVSIQYYLEELAPHVCKVISEMKRLGLPEERAEELVEKMFANRHPKECGAIDDIMEDIAMDCEGKVALEAL